MRFFIAPSSIILPMVALPAICMSTFLPTKRQLSACTTTCIAQADIQATGCALTDNRCLCLNGAFINQLNRCISKKCEGADILTSLLAVQSLCEAVGV
ncbi:hypothetical protein DFP72DRAFT_898178 [Ephemerocybe angulata]|uniref:CFEM domain-containing protein n=1 Tax=Ephemerocybe angulata TaxID=980116 RepID=A0A8H6M524_9AGAR|nr:hypothetical protein DFP72DRAFT_898178 [Tulosesus angulatus]